MACVAEFTIPPERFPFGETLAQRPEVEIHVDQLVPTDESALPFFWVHGCNPSEFLEYAERESEVRDVEQLERVDDVALFRADWRPNADLVRRIADIDVRILEAVGTSASWRFEVRAEDRESILEFQAAFEREGIPIELERLYDLEEVIDRNQRLLTAKQREVLLEALDEGYFDAPRRATQADLAEEFDVSRRAVAERLRRGMRNVLEETLRPHGGEESDSTPA